MGSIDTLLIAGAALFLFVKMKQGGLSLGDAATTTPAPTTPAPATKPAAPAPATGGGGGGKAAGKQIYPSGGQNRISTTMQESGAQGATDGIRWNLTNNAGIFNRETTWIYTLSKVGPTKGKDHYSPKIGSHSNSGSFLYEASVNYAGGFYGTRIEAPHGTYIRCTGGWNAASIPAHPLNKPVGIKACQWKIAGGTHVEFWYDFTGGGNGTWIKYATLDDTGAGKCGKPPMTSIMDGGKQDTMRLNGGYSKYISGSIREINPGGSGAATATKAAYTEVY